MHEWEHRNNNKKLFITSRFYENRPVTIVRNQFDAMCSNALHGSFDDGDDNNGEKETDEDLLSRRDSSENRKKKSDKISENNTNEKMRTHASIPQRVECFGMDRKYLLIVIDYIIRKRSTVHVSKSRSMKIKKLKALFCLCFSSQFICVSIVSSCVAIWARLNAETNQYEWQWMKMSSWFYLSLSLVLFIFSVSLWTFEQSRSFDCFFLFFHMS